MAELARRAGIPAGVLKSLLAKASRDRRRAHSTPDRAQKLSLSGSTALASWLE